MAWCSSPPSHRRQLYWYSLPWRITSIAVGFQSMRFGDEPHFLDAGPLTGQDDAADRFETHILVAANMHFRQGLVGRLRGSQLVDKFPQHRRRISRNIVVIDGLVTGDDDDDVFRLRYGDD